MTDVGMPGGKRGRLVNVGLLVAAALVYGGIFAVNRLAAEAGWAPVGFAFAQALVGGALLAVYGLSRGEALVVSRRSLVSYLVIGALVIGLPISILTRAALHVPSSTLTLVLALSPVLTLCFSVILRIERFRWAAVIGLLFGLSGLMLVVSPGSDMVAPDGVSWFLIALIAPVMFAAANISAAVLRPPATRATTMAAGILLGAAVVAGPIALALSQPLLPPANAQALVALALASAIDIIFFSLLFVIVERAGPTFFSQFNFLAVLSGVGWSFALFSEQPTMLFVVALLLMLAGVFVSIRK